MPITQQRYSFDVPAGGTVRVAVVASFFRITACSGLVDVDADAARLVNCTVGDGWQKSPFSFVTLKDKSGATNTVVFVVADSDTFLNAPNSSTTVTGNTNTRTGLAANTAKTVTTTSGQLVAANTARNYLLVQNKDAAGNVWLNFGAGAATSVNGVKIPPGGSWEWDSTIPTTAVQAIGDIASNANVVVVEG